MSDAARDLDWLEPAVSTKYVRVPEWLIDRTDLSARAKALYAVLGRHINRGEGGVARPGQARLCALLGCGTDGLTSATRELRGWREGDDTRDASTWTGPAILYVKRRGQGLTNLYRLRFSEPDADEIKTSAQPESRTRLSRSAESGSAGVQNTLDPGTNQTEKNQTEKNQGANAPSAGEIAAGIDPEAAAQRREQLAAVKACLERAGYNRGAIEIDEPSIVSALAFEQPPQHTNWDAVADRIAAANAAGQIRGKRPSSAVLFVLRSFEPLPLFGQALPSTRPGTARGASAAMVEKFGAVGRS
ncbi:MAG: hypothetical protein PGN13_15955 [Patulibacter minatonensis]